MTNQPIDAIEANEPQRKKTNKKKVFIIILSIILAAILIVTATVLILIKQGEKKLVDNTGINIEQNEEIFVEDDIITYNDSRYQINENVTSILFIGVDKRKINEDKEIGSNGQADTLFLACLDTKTNDIKIIPVSRESMVDFDLFDKSGKFAGTKNGQICLSFAYSNDAKGGSENVKNAVSRLLCGVNINSYVAVDLGAIVALTSEIGGVELTSLETVSRFKKGEKVNLQGYDAFYYLQSRGTDVDANNRRQARQKQFLKAFATKMGNNVVSDFTKLVKYYNIASPYFTSDLDLSEITYLAKTCLSKDIGEKVEYLNISGETKIGEKYVEFYPDENSIYEAVLEAFYVKID